jgi:CRISP-associated protein Cas1
MKKLLNTLYVNTQGSYLRREGETVVVEQERKRMLQVPIHTLGNIICFGNVLCSPYLLGLCGERDISISFLTEYGRFLAAVNGPVSGNVLLRREQYRMADCQEVSASIARNIILGKIANSKVVLSRAIRDHGDKMGTKKQKIEEAIKNIIRLSKMLEKDHPLEYIRGIEGIAASQYFGVFNMLIHNENDDFKFDERNRRPPLDRVNAMLSFSYTILAHDVRSALETVGLDPAVGYLHRDRPGRPGLALDLMEEFRPVVADRLILSLINRRQVKGNGFRVSESGAVLMDEETRKILLSEYQRRKQKEVFHPFIKEKVPIGLLFFIQANLMARYLRGDISGYPPFFWR